MDNRKCSKYQFALALIIALGAAVCFMPSEAYAGGVHFGIGVDVPLPGPPAVVYTPPPAVYAPPAVVERAAPPVVVERPRSRVVVREVAPAVVYQAPAVVYQAPMVVERRSTEYYYPAPAPSYEYQERRTESHREYYRESSRSYDDYDEY